MTYSVPDDVAWLAGDEVLSSDEAVYVLKLPDGQPSILEGTAALIWTLAVEGEPVVQTITDSLDAGSGDVAGDVRTFLAALVANGWLKPTTEEA